jgi:CheY-like chemotaxis protein
MRILVVEDHMDSGKLLTHMLRGQGHDVRAVETASDALGACADQSFDLLISDIGLPDLSGWELLRRVREHCDIPAIALSAFTAPADLERSRTAGFAAHLAKPVSFETLAVTVARFAG